MDLSWACPFRLLSGVVNTLLQCQTTHLLSLGPHVLRHWVLPAHLTLPAVHLGSFCLTSNDRLADLFTVFFLTHHTSLVLLNNPGVLQQSQLCKTWCGLSLLKPNCFLNIVGLCIIAYVLHMVLEICCCIAFCQSDPKVCHGCAQFRTDLRMTNEFQFNHKFEASNRM